MKQDIEKLYNYLKNKKQKINQLYSYLETKQYDKLKIIDKFALFLDLKLDDKLRYALVTRIVSLRDDTLVQVLQQQNYNDKQIDIIKQKAYDFTKDYWLDIHKQTIDYINMNNLLTPFYQAVFEGVYNVGVVLSKWQTSWTNKIINGINKQLLEQFDQNENEVIEFLKSNNLLDTDQNGTIAPRAYSVLVKTEDDLKSLAYIDAFKQEVTDVVDELEKFVDKLILLEDTIYNQKWEYINYLQALITAFSERRTNMLLSKWADVDIAWMKITTPIQIGHPLEYYEDHLRKAVALEWDIRLADPNQQENHRATKIKHMFKTIYDKIPYVKEYQDIYNFSLNSLNKIQLYISTPALFFASEFNGLFSAQVVPNDENVSKEYGKKIFAFSNEILQLQRAKPFLQLQKEIFPKDFLQEDRKFLFQETKKWHQVYDIATIGHEFGHILWCDKTTEIQMNKSGQYKNLEEFKATSGGIVSFFVDNTDEKELERFVINDIIKRSIGLISWMEVDEVLPYYCEGLIHLFGLFDIGVLSWQNNILSIDRSPNKIEDLKQWYIDTYILLAKHYLDKKDSKEFLDKFIVKRNNIYTSIDPNIASFVEYYYQRYKQIGQQIDTSDTKDNYLI
jgi:hypothetical protein